MREKEVSSIFSIEVLRGMAVLLVAYLHAREVGWIGARQYWEINGLDLSIGSLLALLSQPIVFGSIGVPIFFVLSGYCIHRKTARMLVSNKLVTNSAGNFLLRRFIRIYPVLIGAMLLTFLFDSASMNFPHPNSKLQDVGIVAFLVNLFAVQGIAGPTYGSNGALWSLSIEIQFYLVYPILLHIREKIGAHKLFLWIAVLNVLSCVMAGDVKIFTSYYLSWYLGFYIAELEAEKYVTALSRKQIFAFAIGFFVFGVLMYFLKKMPICFASWSIAFAFYLWSVLHTPYSFNIASKILAFFGKISYSLYAIHLPIFVFLVSYFYDSSKPVSILPSFGFLLAVIVCAYLFHLVIERPTMRLLEKMNRRAVLNDGKDGSVPGGVG